ncbi:MAG: helix-turn-helix domain-containing protein [Kiritimatiellae bacterium]|jgi:DNA-binding IclR family transcriptional regulator|nr:helix-turn-helix domain-containing protein [Kiritimatiellia bacterium]
METNTNTIPALERAILYLKSLAESHSGMSQPELCKQLGITQSSCSRITQTFLEHGWIFKREKNIYDLAPGLLSLTKKLADQTKRLEVLYPQMRLLSEKSGLSCKLSVRQGMDQVVVLRSESPRPMSISGKIGVHFPIIEGSVGATLLLEHSNIEIITLVDECKELIAEKKDPSLIFNRLKELRENGYTFLENNRWNVEAISAPIYNKEGHIEAALTMLGFPHDFEGSGLATLGKMLTSTAKKCSKEL